LCFPPNFCRGVSAVSRKQADWTFSTDYRGTISDGAVITPSEKPIPIDELRRPDPIVMFGEIILFEDELHDHGVSILSAKVLSEKTRESC